MDGMKQCINCDHKTHIKRATNTLALVICTIITLFGIAGLTHAITGEWGLVVIAAIMTAIAPGYYYTRKQYCRNCSGRDLR